MNWFVKTLTEFGITVPEVFVETGSFRGDGVQQALGYFREIHTIELDLVFYMITLDRFKGVENVHCHHGDSAHVIDALSIEEPALFYLDAHYSGGATAYGPKNENGCPVLRELKAIGKRNYDDVIVIDDMRLMGQEQWSGEDGTDWPKTKFDWRHATINNMLAAYGKPVEAALANDIDRLVLWSRHDA